MANPRDYVFKLVRNRRATKRMLPEYTIPDDQLRIITEAARWTSMSYGVWDYRIIVIPRGKLRDELTEPFLKQPSFINCSHAIIFIHDKEDKIRKIDFKESFDKSIPDSASQVREIMIEAVLNNWKMNDVNPTEWSAKQAYISLGTVMIAAADLSIDSAPWEGFDRKAVELVLKKHNLIDIKNEQVAVAIGLGKANLKDEKVHFFEKTRMDENKFTTIAKD